jgi:hypothetical protein
VANPAIRNRKAKNTVITTAAWRSKPSWMLVAGADRTVDPDLERWYVTRAKRPRAAPQRLSGQFPRPS